MRPNYADVEKIMLSWRWNAEKIRVSFHVLNTRKKLKLDLFFLMFAVVEMLIFDEFGHPERPQGNWIYSQNYCQLALGRWSLAGARRHSVTNWKFQQSDQIHKDIFILEISNVLIFIARIVFFSFN